MLDEILPSSVRYVKNRRRSQWWSAAKTHGQIHGGWKNIPDELLSKNDLAKIEQLIKEQHGARPRAKQDFNQVHDLLNAPSRHIWVTFEDLTNLPHTFACSTICRAGLNFRVRLLCSSGKT